MGARCVLAGVGIENVFAAWVHCRKAGQVIDLQDISIDRLDLIIAHHAVDNEPKVIGLVVRLHLFRRHRLHCCKNSIR